MDSASKLPQQRYEIECAQASREAMQSITLDDDRPDLWGVPNRTQENLIMSVPPAPRTAATGPPSLYKASTRAYT